MTNQELSKLKSIERDAFARKQAAYKAFAEAKIRARDAHDAMESAWTERCRTREDMEREYKALRAASDLYREVWGEYKDFCDYVNPRITSLREMADTEHQAMVKCFAQANREYEAGNKSAAALYASMGHDHRNCRDKLNSEMSELCREVKSAKQNAKKRAPGADSTAYRAAKDAFERAKAVHQATIEEFKRLKAERDRLRKEFDAAYREHQDAEDAFRRQVEALNSQS